MAATVDQRFELETPYRSGGMGTVWKARDLRDARTVALKILHKRDLEDAARFVRESALLAQLSHPNIVAYVAHGTTEDDAPYLAMEWLEGENLAERLARQPLTLSESLTLLRASLSGLSIAHARGIVHRDLKPSNLFLRSGNIADVVLLDLGLACQVDAAHDLTHSGSVIGTPSYMPPEQAQGQRDLGPSADVFSMGCVLFECLTGTPPFVGAHLITVLAKVLFEPAPRLRELRPEMPPALEELLEHMLHKDPRHRPADARVLIGLLRALGEFPDQAPLRASAAMPTPSGREQALVSVILAVPCSPRATAQLAVGDDVTLHDLRPEAAPDVAAYGGEFKRLADGSSVITLAQRRSAATDLVARAARCALELQRASPHWSFVLATGRGVPSERSWLGEAVERAGIMLRARSDQTPAGIWLDEVTAGLLSQRFRTVRLDEGIVVFELRGEDPSVDEARPLLGKPTACVGRDHELGILELALRTCTSESSPRAVLVHGPAGIGKSRLRHEFLRHAQGLTLLLGLGDPIRASGNRGLLGGALLRLCELRSGGSDLDNRARFEARIGRHLTRDVERTCAFIAELCGLRYANEQLPELRAARQNPSLMADLIAQAFLTFLRAELAHGAVLIVLDDLQWSDALSVALAGAALRELSSSALLVLALGRPETLEMFPDLWAPRLVTLPLNPLGSVATRKLIHQVLGEQFSAESVDRMVTQAGGNALYLEELIRAADAKRIAVPETVIAMLQSRIGLLPVAERRVLRAASVFGERFWTAGVTALLQPSAVEAELERLLAGLRNHEIVEPYAPDDHTLGYRFRHVLMRDAAYALIADADLVSLHATAARYLETQAEEPDVIAAHWERGREPERAITCYTAAARQASARNDLSAVIALVARAYACGARAEPRGVLRSLEAPARCGQYDFQGGWDSTAEALLLLPAEHPDRVQSLGWSTYAGIQLGKSLEVSVNLEELLAAAPPPAARGNYVSALGYATVAQAVMANRAESLRLLTRIEEIDAEQREAEPYTHGQWLYWHMRYLQFLGDDTYATYQLAERGVAHHRQSGDRRFLAFTLIQAGECARHLFSVSEGIARMREAAELTEEIADPAPALFAQQYLATLLAEHGAAEVLPEARARAQSAMRAAGSGAGYRALSQLAVAWVCIRCGEYAEAEREARAADGILRGLGLRAYFPYADRALIEVLLARGAIEAASERADLALAEIERWGPCGLIEIALRLSVARAQHAAGRSADALRSVNGAQVVLERRAAKIPDAELRGRFLRDVPEHAALAALASELGSQ